jgi:hypothetical protein
MAAFCFDRAVTHFGMHVQNAIDKATAKVKNETSRNMAATRTLNKYLFADGAKVKGRYADPAAGRRR